MHDDDDYDEPEDQDQTCPFCESLDSCPHLLLRVDMTFRSSEYGLLDDAFSARWSRIFESQGDDPNFDKDVAFMELVDEVADLSDAELHLDSEGGPGMSSSINVYYISTPEKAADLVSRFREANT